MSPVPQAAKEILTGTAAAVGAVPLRLLSHTVTERGAEVLRPFRSVICAAFPYFAGAEPGNLSLYCRGPDYHQVVGDRLKLAAERLHRLYPRNLFHPFLDSGLLSEVAAARLSGVAMTGWHGLAILPPHGSFVFLGCIAADIDVPAPADAGTCDGCGRCIRACPGGALERKNGRTLLRRDRCLSYLTQQREDPGEPGRTLISDASVIWGCDLCQLACPHNRDLPAAPIPEFSEGLLPSLEPEALEGLSRKAFEERFPRRAFTYRGPGPLLRNLRLQKKKRQSPERGG